MKYQAAKAVIDLGLITARLEAAPFQNCSRVKKN